MPRRRPLAAALVALCLVAAGCGEGGDARRREVAPAPTTAAPAPATTEAPPTSAEPGPAQAQTSQAAGGPSTSAATSTTGRRPAPAAAAACPALPARAEPRPDRPRYVLSADVRLDENVVLGTVDVRFTPDLATDRLVFRLWANSPRTAAAGARMEVGEVAVGGRPAAAAQPDATTLVVTPATPLGRGQSVDVSLPWRLTLPGAANDRLYRNGEAVRLGSFFPILAWEPGLGWATEPPTSGFAEASVAPVADFTATVTVPEGLSVMATGQQDGAGRWTATAVPDFAASIGRFTVETRTVAAPDPVQVTVGIHAGVGEAPGPYLDKLGRVLEDFSGRYGAYPWPSYSLAVTPGLSGGIEYPMHVMQGPGRIGRTTSHEVAHMWFYGLVGNNQGRDPWLDEGVATWAEARYENTLAEVRATSIPPGGRGRAGEPMSYWESRQSIYYRSVYVQGAQALAALGDPDLVDCGLRHYVAASAYRVARPADLLGAMRTVFPQADEVLARYGIRAG